MMMVKMLNLLKFFHSCMVFCFNSIVMSSSESSGIGLKKLFLKKKYQTCRKINAEITSVNSMTAKS